MSAPIVRVPLGCSAPLHPPVAVQVVALVEVHVRVADLPLAIELGAALTDAVGAGDVEFGPVPTLPPPQAASSSDNPSKPRLVVIGI